MNLIDRDALIAEIKVKRDYTDTSVPVGRGECIALNKVLTMIDEQPTVEAEPVQHGEWTRPSRPKTYERICSECGVKAYFCGQGDYDFCPNCGAKMDGTDSTQSNTLKALGKEQSDG